MSRSWITRAQRTPLAWVLAMAIGLRVIGLCWGLPSSDAWDNDGIAPRDFWPGLIESFTRGHFFTYPPAHLALLALLTSPVTALVLARAPTLSVSDVIGEALKVPYMTSYTLIARAVTAGMSIGVIYAISKIAEEIAGRRAGLLAAVVSTVNVIFTYYSHTSNLDVPYLCWATFAVLALTRCIARDEPRRLRASFVLAAVAIASKDQAYALFLLGIPLSLATAALVASPYFAKPRVFVIELAWAFALSILALGLLDGAVVNPSGFRARLDYLTGPATEPYAYYSADAWGRILALYDTVRRFDEHYPLLLAPFVIGGLVRTVKDPQRRRRAAGLVPMWAALSYSLLFNCVARRTEQRFLMPQMVLWAVYAGIGLDWLWEKARLARGYRWHHFHRWLPAAVCALGFGWAFFRCADVDANLMLDPRYEAEDWLARHVAPGDALEVHGKSVYLLRPPKQARVIRVGPEPVASRNPLYRAEEREDKLVNIGARSPRWIVVSPIYAGKYLRDVGASETVSGRMLSKGQAEAAADMDASSFFRGLVSGRLGYGLVHVSTWKSSFWPRLDIHGSVAPDVWIFERIAG
jgi:hypothetical protein